MSIRQPAAEKLVRQLLELRLYRLAPLSDEIIAKLDASQGGQATATGLADR